MKLLVVCQYFYPEQFRVSEVCFKLASLGHEVTVLTGLPNYPTGKILKGYEWYNLKEKAKTNSESSEFSSVLNAFTEMINGVKVVRCNHIPRGDGKLGLILNYFSFAYSASKLATKLIKNDFYFDRILVFQYSPVTMALPGIIIKKKLKKPLFLYCFDLWPESIVSAGLPSHGVFYGIVLLLSRSIYKKADTILISSKGFIKYFHEKLKIKNRIEYLPIFAEKLFDQIESDTEDDNLCHLVFAGNIGEMQSIDTIIKAADLLKNNRNIHFHIIGDGSALNRSIHLANTLELENVTFHGWQPLEEMPKYYSFADAFLLTLKDNPSISYTLPGKVQSYMAAGKPIIAAINGEASEIINESECGLCCSAGDYKSLAGLIQTFFKEKENRQVYGDNSKKYYEKNYTEESFIESLLAIIC